MAQRQSFQRPRLVGSAALVWRSASDLQVGLDDDAVVLSAVPRRSEEVLKRLDGHHSLGDLESHLPAAWISWLVDSLASHGRLAEGPPVRRQHTMRVLGTGLLGTAVATSLAATGVRLRVADAGSHHLDRSRHLVTLLSIHRRPADRPVLEPDLDVGSAPPVTLTLVATDSAEPDRALTDLLVAARLPHLLVRLQPGRAIVGPLVVPGQTACLRCADLARTAADPGWPVVACQLAGLLMPAATTSAAWATSLAVAHATAYAAGGAPESLTGTVELADDGLTRFRRWAVHPGCSCRNVDLVRRPARMGA